MRKTLVCLCLLFAAGCHINEHCVKYSDQYWVPESTYYVAQKIGSVTIMQPVTTPGHYDTNCLIWEKNK